MLLNVYFLTARRWKFNIHCVKSVQIRSFFWSVFPCIRTEYRKLRTRKNSAYGHFSRSYFLGIFQKLFKVIAVANSGNTNCRNRMNLSFSTFFHFLQLIILYIKHSSKMFSEVYSEPSRIPMTELFAKIVGGWKLLTFSQKGLS